MATDELLPDADDEEVRDAARAQYALRSNDDIEIDDNAEVSKSDHGWWVAAWVHVRAAEPDDEEDTDAGDLESRPS